MTQIRGPVGMAAALATAALIASGSVAWAQDATTETEASAQEPTFSTSIAVPDDKSLSEAEEAAMLADLATVTLGEAEAAALNEAPGRVMSVELESENGGLVYDVEVLDETGALLEVLVDAGDASIVAVSADEAENEDAAEEGAEADEQGVTPGDAPAG